MSERSAFFQENWWLRIWSGLFNKEKIWNYITISGVTVVDYVMVVAGIHLAYWLRASVFPLYHLTFEVPRIYMDIVIPIVFIFFLHFDRMYLQRLYFWQQAERLFKASIYAISVVLLIMYFTGIVGEISRLFIVLVWLLCFTSLAVGRYFIKQVLVRLEGIKKPIIVLGAGKTAELLLKSFPHHLGTSFRVVGFIEDNPSHNSISDMYPVLGGFSEAERIIKDEKVRNILIAAPGLERAKLNSLVYCLQPYVDQITFIPDLFGVPVSGMEVETLLNEKIVLLRIRNNLAQAQNRLLKWMFDCAGSLIGLILFIPVFIVISLCVYLNSPGKVIFSHRRVGYKGKEFPCYKFRTMVSNAQEVLEQHLEANPEAREEWEREFKLKNDPRITGVGRFLRKTSLDELPQFINVLRGEMSLVGPRPIVNQEISRYGEYIHDYYLVRPGITGMWQVSGRNDVDYPERVRLDSWYVRNWSCWLDLVILFRTIGVVFERRGAY